MSRRLLASGDAMRPAPPSRVRARWLSHGLVIVVAALAAGAAGLASSGCASSPAKPAPEPGARDTVWRGVLDRALALAADDRPDVNAARVRAEVEAIAARLTARLEAEVRPAAAGRSLTVVGRLAAEALAQTLFREAGIAGDPSDPAATSRDLFDLDRVLAARRGTCLAVVVIGAAVAEIAGLQVAPVLTPGHATLAVAPGYLVDPATGGVRAPGPQARPGTPADLLADLYANRASYRRQAGDREGALEDVERALSLAPGLATAHINRAVLYLDLGRAEDAMRDLEVVEASEQGNATSAFNLAIAHARLGTLGTAKHWYRVATERDPRHLKAWVNAGALHEVLHEPIAARTAYEHALAIDPDNPTVRERLARLR